MSAAAPSNASNSTLLILSLVIFSFISFVCIGIPLAALPGYVHGELGFSTTVAGIVIGIQYLATLLCRPWSGTIGDTLGAKKTVVLGMLICMASGALLMLSAWLQEWTLASLLVMLVSRILLGFTQSLIGISAISWGITQLGAQNTARMISWNGIAAYGGVGIGAPLGVLLAGQLGLWSLGALTLILSAGGLYLAMRKEAAPIIRGERMPFRQVLWKVTPHGFSLMLGTIGYGTLSAFIALYYAARGWEGAAWCLTAYACAFIGTRMLFPNIINRLGGYCVAIACLAVEACGLLLLWLADSSLLAMIGSAMAGAGLALLYPALGVEAIKRINEASRSAALSTFAMFFDLAIGLAGPVMGVLATWLEIRHIFLLASVCGVGGLLVAAALLIRQRRAEAQPRP